MSGLMKVPFFSDELLTSWISRMARANGRTNMRGFCRDVGLDLNGISRGEAASVAALEHLLRLRPGELAERTLRKISTRHVRFMGMTFTTGSITPSPLKFCSECLKADEAAADRMPGTRAYGRIQWSLDCMGACVQHDCALIACESRPLAARGRSDQAHSDVRIDYHDFIGLVDHWMRLDNHPESPRLKATDFERFIVARLAGEFRDGAILDAMPLSASIEVCQIFGLAEMEGRTFRWQGKRGSQSREAFEIGYSTLRSGRDGIHKFLDTIAAVDGRSNPRMCRFYGRLTEILYRRSSAYGPIQKVLREREKLQLAALQMPQRIGFTSIGVIAKSVALPARTVARYMVQEGHLQQLKADAAEVLVPAGIASEVTEILSDVATGTDIRRSLGCSTAELRNIAKWGLLHRILGQAHGDRRSGIDLYSRAGILALREKIMLVSVAKKLGSLTLRTAVEQFGIEPGEILALICSGEIKGVTYDPRYPLFEAVELDRDELAAAVRLRSDKII